MKNVIFLHDQIFWLKMLTSKSVYLFTKPNLQQGSINDKIQYHEVKIITIS